MQNKKRILRVRIIQDVDTDPYTSYFGEYAFTPSSRFSIDRAHTDDCASLRASETVAWIERIRRHVTEGDINWVWSPEEVLDEVYKTLDDCEDASEECDCGER